MESKKLIATVAATLANVNRFDISTFIHVLHELKIISSYNSSTNGEVVLKFNEWNELNETRKWLDCLDSSMIEHRGNGCFLLTLFHVKQFERA